jgi:phytoene dehydrogenase-like protein
LRPGVAAAKIRTHKPAIDRDVCIIGGGATGTFSAVHLIDAGKNLALVERKSRLGGHTETYRDPATGFVEDYGVVVYHDIPEVTDFFARFNVPLGPRVTGETDTRNFDFKTGERVPDDILPSPAETGQALGGITAISSSFSRTTTTSIPASTCRCRSRPIC